MIRIYYKSIKQRKIKTLEKFRIGSWLLVEDTQKEQLKELADQFSLDYSLLTDSLDPHEVPRLEIEDDKVYVFTRIPGTGPENHKITTSPVLIVIGDNFLISISKNPLPFLDYFLQGRVNFTTTQKTKLFLQIFNQINILYTTFLTNIRRDVGSISVRLENIQNKDIARFVMFERILNNFLSALLPTNNILAKLLSGKIIKFYEEDEDLVQDLLLSNGQLIELSKSNLSIIRNIRDAYSNIMTNNLNRTIKFLTALTIVLNIPMIVSSFYGMNVKLPLAWSPLAFWQLTGFTAIITVFLILIFYKKNWL